MSFKTTYFSSFFLFFVLVSVVFFSANLGASRAVLCRSLSLLFFLLVFLLLYFIFSIFFFFVDLKKKKKPSYVVD